jgi:hypothetical protein
LRLGEVGAGSFDNSTYEVVGVAARERLTTATVVEMEEILRAAGFEVVWMYWDLERAQATEAEFLTYVARRI